MVETENIPGGNLHWEQSSKVLRTDVALRAAGADPEKHVGRWGGACRDRPSVHVTCVVTSVPGGGDSWGTHVEPPQSPRHPLPSPEAPAAALERHLACGHALVHGPCGSGPAAGIKTEPAGAWRPGGSRIVEALVPTALGPARLWPSFSHRGICLSAAWFGD